MDNEVQVHHPLRKTEYLLVFGSTRAKRGWQDLLATHRKLVVDAWEFLSKAPYQQISTNYPLKGRFATFIRNGAKYERWQYKLSAKISARIWFYLDGDQVILDEVHTHHPKETVWSAPMTLIFLSRSFAA